MTITLAQLVNELEHFGSRYISAAVFSDDLYEMLVLSKRAVPDSKGHSDIPLREVRPGQFEFVIGDAARPYTIQARKTGGTELQRGHGLKSFTDRCPIPVLSVKKAEALKGSLISETFLLLKGPPIKDSEEPHWCFLLHRTHGEWEAYQGGLVEWVKQALWPERSMKELTYKTDTKASNTSELGSTEASAGEHDVPEVRVGDALDQVESILDQEPVNLKPAIKALKSIAGLLGLATGEDQDRAVFALNRMLNYYPNQPAIQTMLTAAKEFPIVREGSTFSQRVKHLRHLLLRRLR